MMKSQQETIYSKSTLIATEAFSNKVFSLKHVQNVQFYTDFQKQVPEVSYKKSCCSLRPATLFKKRLWHRFSCEFCKISRKTFFTEHLQATASRFYNFRGVFRTQLNICDGVFLPLTIFAEKAPS